MGMGEPKRESADVLLVEDNPGDVRLTREAFEANGIDVTLHVVEDGGVALDFYYRRGEYVDAPRPDLVLLDLNLPQTGGEEVLETLCDEPTLRVIPVIVLSGSENQTDVVTAYENCANAYLVKPVDPDEFIDAIHSLERFWLSAARLPDGVP